MLPVHGRSVADRISEVIPSKSSFPPFYIPDFHNSIDKDIEKSVLAIVLKLRWKHVIVVSDSMDVIKSFSSKAAAEDMCITRHSYIRLKRYFRLHIRKRFIVIKKDRFIYGRCKYIISVCYFQGQDWICYI